MPPLPFPFAERLGIVYSLRSFCFLCALEFFLPFFGLSTLFIQAGFQSWTEYCNWFY